ncbi:hypothetical protein CR513_12839, partial [Mucuna pruriens]
MLQEDETVNSTCSKDKSSSIRDSNMSTEYSLDDEGDLLMRCLMNVQVGEDGGISVNVASSRLVDKLKLPTLAHPRPYMLQRQIIIHKRLKHVH